MSEYVPRCDCGGYLDADGNCTEWECPLVTEPRYAVIAYGLTCCVACGVPIASMYTHCRQCQRTLSGHLGTGPGAVQRGGIAGKEATENGRKPPIETRVGSDQDSTPPSTPS